MDTPSYLNNYNDIKEKMDFDEVHFLFYIVLILLQ